MVKVHVGTVNRKLQKILMLRVIFAPVTSEEQANIAIVRARRARHRAPQPRASGVEPHEQVINSPGEASESGAQDFGKARRTLGWITADDPVFVRTAVG